MSVEIHPQAIVEQSAKLGVDVEVGPFCYIGSDVEIGGQYSGFASCFGGG